MEIIVKSATSVVHVAHVIVNINKNLYIGMHVMYVYVHLFIYLSIRIPVYLNACLIYLSICQHAHISYITYAKGIQQNNILSY